MTERDEYRPRRWYGEIHFYEDGSFRQTNGSSFEKWLAAHDEAVRQEERERCARIADNIEQEARAYAERNAVATENAETAVQRVVAAYIAGASRPATRGTVTEEMVERAAVVFYRSQTGHGGLATSFYAPAWRNVARQALEAALADRPPRPQQTGPRPPLWMGQR